MFGSGRLDEGQAFGSSEGLEADGDDLDPERGDLGAQGLPTWQVTGAASIGGPGDEHHPGAAQR